MDIGIIADAEVVEDMPAAELDRAAPAPRKRGRPAKDKAAAATAAEAKAALAGAAVAPVRRSCRFSCKALMAAAAVLH